MLLVGKRDLAHIGIVVDTLIGYCPIGGHFGPQRFPQIPFVDGVESLV